jgi:hypothetical protein
VRCEISRRRHSEGGLDFLRGRAVRHEAYREWFTWSLRCCNRPTVALEDAAEPASEHHRQTFEDLLHRAIVGG